MDEALPPSTDADLWVSWTEYHASIERLCVKLHESGWPFDQILCLARGGLRIGDVVSRVFDKPLAILAASSYRQGGGTVQGHLDLARTITMNAPTLAGRLLVIDDLVDSGRTILEVVARLTREYPSVTEVRTAVLWWKACSAVTPDFWCDHLPSNPWIHQPFETYDTLRPDALAARHARGQETSASK